MKSYIKHAVALLSCLAITVLGNPISNCAGAIGVNAGIIDLTNNKCALPAQADIPFVSVNDNFLSGGATCGACYQLTGPKGLVTVMVVNSCTAANTIDCQAGNTTFAVSGSTYNLIGDNSTSTKIYDLSYQQVTCPVAGNGNVAFTVGTNPTSTYFSLTFTNARTAITSVAVKGAGMSRLQSLNRRILSGVWEFNKQDTDFKFPVEIVIQGDTRDQISTTISSAWSAGSTLSFGSQFRDAVAVNNSNCPTQAAPGFVYQDSLANGWLADASASDRSLAWTENCLEGTCIRVNTGTEEANHLQLARDGGINTAYFAGISLAVRSEQMGGSLRIEFDGTRIFGGDQAIPLTTTWTTYTRFFNASNNAIPANFKVLHFYNDGSIQNIFLDNIEWIEAEVTPIEEVTKVTTDTTGVVEFVTTGTNEQPITTTSEGSTGGSGSSSSATVLYASSLLLGVVALCLF